MEKKMCTLAAAPVLVCFGSQNSGLQGNQYSTRGNIPRTELYAESLINWYSVMKCGKSLTDGCSNRRADISRFPKTTWVHLAGEEAFIIFFFYFFLFFFFFFFFLTIDSAFVYLYLKSPRMA